MLDGGTAGDPTLTKETDVEMDDDITEKMVELIKVPADDFAKLNHQQRRHWLMVHFILKKHEPNFKARTEPLSDLESDEDAYGDEEEDEDSSLEKESEEDLLEKSEEEEELLEEESKIPKNDDYGRSRPRGASWARRSKYDDPTLTKDRPTKSKTTTKKDEEKKKRRRKLMYFKLGDERFVMNKEYAAESTIIGTFYEIRFRGRIHVPIKGKSSRIIRKALEFCKERGEIRKKLQDADQKFLLQHKLNDFDTNFLVHNQADAFDLADVACVLQIKSLFYLMTNFLADVMSQKTPDNIRNIFDIYYHQDSVCCLSKSCCLLWTMLPWRIFPYHRWKLLV